MPSVIGLSQSASLESLFSWLRAAPAICELLLKPLSNFSRDYRPLN